MSFKPEFQLLPRHLRQLKAIDNTAGFLEAVRLRPEWIAKVRSKAVVEEALASVQIEGNVLTLEQAFAIAEGIHERELTNPEREFYNYLKAFDAIEDLRGVREEKITRGAVLNLHRILVEGVRGGSRVAGQIRREDVKIADVGGGETVIHHEPPPWSQVEGHLDDLLDWIEITKKKDTSQDDPWVHPVVQAGIVHHRIVWIHPFVDGNGRTARMLTTLLLFQRGYDFKYLFQLSSYYNDKRDAYYAGLRAADSADDYTEWLTYFLGGFAYQLVRIKQRARRGETGGE